ncbi:MAG: ABC transporter permease [Candidatus Woesearchaeota archaeon]
MNKYLHIAKTNLFNSTIYLKDLVWSSAFIVVIIFILANLWKVIFGTNEYIAGFTLVMMIWYVVMTESIVTSQSRVLEEIGDEVINGNIANYLTKPYNYIMYKYAYNFGRAILKFTITFVMCAVVAYLMIGPLNINIIHIPFILLIVMLAITLDFIIMSFIGIFAFWFEDSKALAFIYSKIVFTIGGMLVPLEIFPLWLYNISIKLPFSYIAYYPAKLFVNFTFQSFLQVLLVQIVWIIIFGLLALITYNKLIKKLSINGG